MNKSNILKEASFLLIATVLTLSAIVVVANTRDGTQLIRQTMDIKNPLDDNYCTILYEDFEDGVMPPEYWSTIDTNPTDNWMIIDADTCPECVHSGDYAGWVNYNEYVSSDEWLISYYLNLTNWDTVTLEFWAFSDTNWPNATVELHIQSDGWDWLIWDMIEDENWDDLVYREMTFDLTPWIEEEYINISWRYVGLNGPYFGLDDIRVYCTGREPIIADAGGPYETTVNEEIYFIGNSSGGTFPHNYLWDFGNGDISEQQNPYYTYEEPGVYQIILTVDDEEGNLDVDYALAIILEPE